MSPLVETKILFRLELGFARDAEYPLCISIQCGYKDCAQYVDAPDGTPVLCVPIEQPTEDGSTPWADAINEAYKHLVHHQLAHEERN